MNAPDPLPASVRVPAPHPEYAITALVLQGGGALGAYQAGVVQGLAENGIAPNWVAGISIGAINAAIIAGNAPERRVERLRAFWEFICRQPWGPSFFDVDALRYGSSLPPALRVAVDSMEATRAVLEGQNGFFVPRPWLGLGGATGGPHAASYYDTRPLRATLERFADFDRVNRPADMRVSVGAVNVRTGNLRYFDNAKCKLGPEHFMASGALPPGFPAVEIDGEYFWDGGLVSNTPLQYVVANHPKEDALIFQIDLWSALGALPTDLLQVAVRQKDIQYSSRTRMVTDAINEEQVSRRLLYELLQRLPESERHGEWYRRAQERAAVARRNVIHLIYRNKPYESYAKDYQFGRLTMDEHWSSGCADIAATLSHREWLQKPPAEHPFVTHDLHRARSRSPADAAPACAADASPAAPADRHTG
jgi:NTE family protein